VEDPIRRAFYQVFGIAVLGLLALVPLWVALRFQGASYPDRRPQLPSYLYENRR